MTKEFMLPDIGEGLTEGEIVKWFVKEGQKIAENDPLVEVMTEKVNVEIPSPFTGTVLKILAEEGQMVNVGEAIVVVGEEGEAVPEAETEAAAPKEEEEPAEEVPAEAPAEEKAPEKAEAPAGKILTTPAVRRRARELDVDLAQVTGTGSRGRITARDVEKFAQEAEVTPEAIPEVAPEEAVPKEEAVPPKEELIERVPIHGIRRTISERMHRSKATAAHFTYVEEVDVTELVALRERAMTWSEEKGVKLTYLPFILKALVAALKEHPWLNAAVDWEKNEVLLKRYYNVGVATATDQGLMVPVVKQVDQKTVLELAEEIEELSEKARAGKLTLPEVQDSTFTVTSLGLHGGVLATPIINPPEVAILGIHKIAKRPVVRKDKVVARDVMNLSLSFDHRIVDGHVGAAFTQTLVRYLEDPGLLLLRVLESEK